MRSLSSAALRLARASGDDRALADALHARKQASPGPAGRADRMLLAAEMLDLARRTGSPRIAMWGELWRIDGLLEDGRLAAAAEELAALQAAVERIGGPVSAWHADRVTACLAQAQGRFAEALSAGRRAFERMRGVEPGPARGAWFALQCTLARHSGVPDEAAEFLRQAFDPLPRFRSIGPVTRAALLLRAGRTEDAAESYARAGPVESWSLPAFHLLHGYANAVLAAAGLDRRDDLAALLDRLEPFRGAHVVGEGVCYLGPVELTLGRGEAALGRLDPAVEDLSVAAEGAERAGAPAFVAEARYHLATTLLARDRPGDLDRALFAARQADRLARALGMSAYTDRTGSLVARLGSRPTGALSAREAQIAALVAEGLTNRQIASRLVISERTAQNHVQHILDKLGFASRSRIAAWHAGDERRARADE